MLAIQSYASAAGSWQVGELPEGADAYVFAHAAKKRAGLSIFVARDDARASAVRNMVKFFAPELTIWDFPAWDCLPYDRISPSRWTSAKRAGTLHQLCNLPANAHGIVITTVNALGQKVPPRSVIQAAGLSLQSGKNIPRETLDTYFTLNGYSRASTVIEPGDFAVRGGVVDVFAAGFDHPIRLDFFGDELESIRAFDVETQRSTGTFDKIDLSPGSEIFLSEDTIANFRRNYVVEFGGGLSADPVYAAVSEGIRYQGLEHWLPLLYPKLETLFDYLPKSALWAFDALYQEASKERDALVDDYYQARQAAQEKNGSKGASRTGISEDHNSYRPIAPEKLYVSQQALQDTLKASDNLCIRYHSQFTREDQGGSKSMNLGAKSARNFSTERQSEGVNVFGAASDYLRELVTTKQKVLLASWSDGSNERMGSVFADHDLVIGSIDNAKDIANMGEGIIKRIVLPIENGFSFNGLTVLSEQDILGDRLVRKGRRKRSKNFIAEVSALQENDLVIHIDHGLGRYVGLETLDVQNAPHDCLKIEYAGESLLYLPVENIELLSRYGAAGDNPVLDKLGGTAWQSRKAKAKQRLKYMASALIKTAAARALKTCDAIEIPRAEYDEFCARFPYAETDDQLHAIEDIENDLTSGRPMDRLICGDVGFGKTEVALRAAFLMAMSGQQVAIIAPTTILARQHFITFSERFKNLPIKIRQLSRLVSTKQANFAREELRNGQCDIIIGTHALLAKSISFSDLGLLVIDEEQRFGVQHKENLKSLKSNVHVLTLTATPIPRTLQMSLSGIRDLSLIATPPVDRLAVRTYITPYDQVILREALLREKYRGGQSFFVVPRIADIRQCEEFLREFVPEVNYVIANGQMASGALEDVMSAFYDRQYDVLLSTSIIESGVDIPSANTMVIYRADRFGLAQLYQMRGRVGRSKTRAYAYMTTPETHIMTKGAMQRLKILQSLDTLGAGFSLASHDLDMRGGGNPLGEEQSGHIKDLGVELYQHMLEEAVAQLKQDDSVSSRAWSAQINVGVPILIPETYVKDLNLRMSLYRRLSEIGDDDEAHAFRAEMIDRFGALPDEVKYLLQVMNIKRMAKIACIAKVDAGPKGCVYTFRHEDVKDPAVILGAIAQNQNWRLRPDQTVFVHGRLDEAKTRLNAVETTLKAFLSVGAGA